MTVTKTKLFRSLGLLLLLGAGVAVKPIHFPSADEKFCQFDCQRLLRTPANRSSAAMNLNLKLTAPESKPKEQGTTQ